MKKTFCVLVTFLLLLILPNPALAYAEKSIMLSPFVYLGGHADIQYERSISNRGSYLITGQLVDNHNFYALGIGAGYRKYFGTENFSHAFGQGSLGVLYGLDQEEHKSHGSLSLGGALGYKWIFKKGFSLETNAGIDFYFSNSPYIAGGKASTFRLKMGYSW